jgi:integrase
MDSDIQPPEKKMRKKHPEKALTAAGIRNAGPGKHADGNGLYLVVDPNGAKRWILRTVIKGKRCDIGLGGLSLVSLSEAREEAVRLRRMARKGGDPLAERRRERLTIPTFEVVAREVHASHSTSFRNEKHKADWLSSLQMYVFSSLGSRPIDTIESKEILQVLLPIWTKKPETARRVKQRMQTIFNFARARGWAPINPVDGIESALPKHSDKQQHFASLPYAQVPDFLQSLRSSSIADSVKLAFEFLILTVTRTGEVIYARWNEIDIGTETWAIPAERMKAKVEHRVPLCTRCREILRSARELDPTSEYVFPGRKHGKPLSNMAFLMALRRMEKGDITAHGFRSSFRDWAEEKTQAQRRVVEAALAHTVENKVEAAYLRTDLFEKRRRLMSNWETYTLTIPKQKVVEMRQPG